MLILARKKNETVVINDEIVIEILQIKGNTIRIGIKAPHEMRVMRGELEGEWVDGKFLPLSDRDGRQWDGNQAEGGTSLDDNQPQMGLKVVSEERMDQGSQPKGPHRKQKSQQKAGQKKAQKQSMASQQTESVRASQGLKRFVKAQVNQDHVTYAQDESAKVFPENQVSESSVSYLPTQVVYEGPASRQPVNRLTILTAKDQNLPSRKVSYQTTCEIELPFTQFPSHRN